MHLSNADLHNLFPVFLQGVCLYLLLFLQAPLTFDSHYIYSWQVVAANCSVGSVSSAVMGRCTVRSRPPRVPPSLAVRSRLVALNKGGLWLPVREPSLTTSCLALSRGREQGKGAVSKRDVAIFSSLLTPPLPLVQRVTNWLRKEKG